MRLKIRYHKLANGYETAKFDIHINGVRKFESTGVKYKSNPSNLAERQEKKEKINIIRALSLKREKALLEGVNHLERGYEPNRDFTAYLDEFIANHQVQEIKKFHAMRSKLVAYAGKERIACFEINEGYLRKFVHFLESRLQGESPSNYFAKLKQVIKAALSDGVLVGNPVGHIVVRKRQFLQKDVLNYEEIKMIANTPLGNDVVKRAFLFCVFTGLRYCDVSQVRWENISNGKLGVLQKKTKTFTSVPLNEDAKDQLPERGKSHELIFKLPSHAACQKWVKRLVSEAGIDKKISWHSGRHSFGTNLIANGVDVSIASKLLGHTSLANTQRYVKVNDEMKANAIAKLPSISSK
ncbi:MAG: hypothetical protein EOP52_10440 [Sphingobacteriales bacterium]|nr:MAG: hypothetical protein EOP52_10440 [Sphingobacteriales bacterium]